MQNWWIAAMQTTGIWSKEQAQVVSEEVRNYIHKENLTETVEDLTSMLEHKKLNNQSVINNLQDEINELKQTVEELKARLQIHYTMLNEKTLHTKVAREKK